jgi:hypothetical protein
MPKAPNQCLVPPAIPNPKTPTSKTSQKKMNPPTATEMGRKPVETINHLQKVDSLSNEFQHLGRNVRILQRGPYKGRIGTVKRAVTAERVSESNPKDEGRRGVFYAVELEDVILAGLEWMDFIGV